MSCVFAIYMCTKANRTLGADLIFLFFCSNNYSESVKSDYVFRGQFDGGGKTGYPVL